MYQCFKVIQQGFQLSVMADASGLVIGAIAMASLFSTCIDLFDRFELGRNYAYDYEIACTKMCLLKARLSDWGVSLNLGVPGRECPALRGHWTEEQDVVGRSLLGIKEIFENASLLAEKYKLTPERPGPFKNVVLHRSKRVESDSPEPNSPRSTETRWSHLRKRTVWAIHDKQKFDAFIENLSFLIENLEKVTKRIEMRSSKQNPVTSQGEQSPMSDERVTYRAQPESSSRKGAATSGERSVLPDSVHRLAAQMSGNVYISNQKIVSAVGVMGNVGESKKRHIYTGTQTVMVHGFGVLGDVSESAAVNMQEPRAHR
jgi:hypothetical protein